MGVEEWLAQAEAYFARLLSSPERPRPKPHDPWRAYAEERALRYSTSFTANGTVLPRRRTITGSVHGIAMRIDIDKVAKVSARISPSVAGKMCVYSDNMLVDMVTISGNALPDIGEEEFDARFFLRGTDPKVAEHLLTPDVRQALLRFPLGICLNYDSGAIALTWSGDGVVDLLAVDVACDIIVAGGTIRPSQGVYR